MMNRIKILRYFGYLLSVALCVCMVALAFGGNYRNDSDARSFHKENCEQYLSFSHSGYMGAGDSLHLSNFAVTNKTNKRLKNIKIYGRTNAGTSVIEIAELKAKETVWLEFKIPTASGSALDPVFWEPEIWAEGTVG